MTNFPCNPVLLLGFAALHQLLPSQIRINEVLVNPPAGQEQVIELKNYGTVPITLTGWLICVSSTYAGLGNPPATIMPGETLQVHLGINGTNSNADVYITSVSLLNSDSVTLYNSVNMLPSAIADFVSWNAGQANGAAAASVGEWDPADPAMGGLVPSIALPMLSNHSIAYDGTGNSAADWAVDTTPTLGACNETPTFLLQGNACGGTLAPFLRSSPGQTPALGTSFTVELVASPTALPIGLFVSGLQGLTPPISLATVGMPGCLLYVPTDFLATATGAGNVFTLAFSIPASPPLIGSSIWTQGFTLEPGVNPAGILASNAGIATLGQL